MHELTIIKMNVDRFMYTGSLIRYSNGHTKRMTWAGHVARMGEGRGVHRVLVGKPEGKSHWGDPDVDGRIILRWIFGKWEGVETGWSWLRIGIDGGHL